MQRHFGSAQLTPFDMWTSLAESYRVLSEIAVGRDGTSIKKAQQIGSNALVTLKVMPIRDEERRESCRREAELLASANHRNILGFYAAYESRTEFVLVTEYCAGGDLLDKVNSGGKIPENDARDYLHQLVSALHYLNARGIVHRDVKLDNIFVGENNTIKLGDFGFARKFSAGERFSSSCGTLVYVAPELLVVKPDYEPLAAEVYSLGITLFAMCAAYLPYDALDEMQVIADVRKGGCTIPSTFSPELADLVRRMMAVESTRRPTLAQVRASDWVSQSDRFQRSYSHPGTRGSMIETRPRACSVDSGSAISSRLTPVASTKRPVNELQVPTVTATQSSSPRDDSKKRSSWLYRKLVKPFTSRISGSRIDVAPARITPVA